MSTRLETARLVIRTFEPGDGEAWLAMFADPEVRSFLPGPAPTVETFQSAIEGRHAMEREGGYAMWAVDEKETGTFVGQCGLRPVDSLQPQSRAPEPAAEGSRREFDLAYHFTHACWNKGYATEAAITVLAYRLGSSAWTALLPWRCRTTSARGASWRKRACVTRGWPTTTDWQASRSTSPSRNGGGRQPLRQ